MDGQTAWERHRGVSEEAVGRDGGSICGGFEEQPWRLRLRISPDDGPQPGGVGGGPQMFPRLVGENCCKNASDGFKDEQNARR